MNVAPVCEPWLVCDSGRDGSAGQMGVDALSCDLCVCVCVREREREREGQRQRRLYFFIGNNKEALDRIPGRFNPSQRQACASSLRGFVPAAVVVAYVSVRIPLL